jgi:hypothetical protein
MRLWNKIRARFGRAVEADLAEEMRLHRAMLEERFRAEGLDSAEARCRAAREFGSMALPLEDGRAAWSVAWVESVWADARYAVRALMRSKVFAATAVLTLGVGLALATVAFTLFNTYVLRPFAVADPEVSTRCTGWAKTAWCACIRGGTTRRYAREGMCFGTRWLRGECSSWTPRGTGRGSW